MRASTGMIPSIALRARSGSSVYCSGLVKPLSDIVSSSCECGSRQCGVLVGSAAGDFSDRHSAVGGGRCVPSGFGTLLRRSGTPSITPLCSAADEMSPLAEPPALSAPTVGEMFVVLERRPTALAVVASRVATNPLQPIVQEPPACARFV